MTGKEKIISGLYSVGILTTTMPSTRDIANIIIRMYKNCVSELVEGHRGLTPDIIFNVTRGKIESALGVIWENDIAPILSVIGIGGQEEMEIIMERWHP